MAEIKESIEVKNLAELHDWLTKNESRSTGVWLIRQKAGSTGGEYFSYSDMVDELLCFGWIDSLPRKLDDERSMNWISPRKAKSAWSKINKEKIEKLSSQGRLTPTAIAQIVQAKKQGTWDKLSEIEEGIIPVDLITELDKYENAKSNFDGFPKSVKKSILEWIIQAKTEETRKKRVIETAEKASRNIRANQWRDGKIT